MIIGSLVVGATILTAGSSGLIIGPPAPAALVLSHQSFVFCLKIFYISYQIPKNIILKIFYIVLKYFTLKQIEHQNNLKLISNARTTTFATTYSLGKS